MKKAMYVVKKIVMALCMLYTFNLIISATGIIIPINYISIGFVSLLGLPGVFGLLVLATIL